MIVYLNTATLVWRAVYGTITLIITSAIFIAEMHNFRKATSIHIGSTFIGVILTIVGFLSIISLFSRFSCLCIDAVGITVRDVFMIRRCSWISVSFIAEKYRSRGRHSHWGILINPKMGTGARELFVIDQYRIGRSALMQTMQHLWAEANSRADRPRP